MLNKAMADRQSVLAVGLDGSDSSWKALDEAVELSSLKNACLHIVSIQESADVSYSASEVLAVEKTSREKLERAQNKAKEKAKEKNVTVVTEIVTGSSALAMIDYVKSHKVDILVVGDTGHSSIWGALLGTNVEKIVRHSHCSVLVVR